MDKRYDNEIKKKFNKFFSRSVQFVVSVSVLSLFLWYSSGFSIFPQSFIAYFSTCLFSMLTRTLERKYMFLICNVILAILAMSPNFNIEIQASTNIKPQVSQETVIGALQLVENASLMAEEEKTEQEEYDEHSTDTLFVETEGRVSKGSVAEEGGTRSNDVMDELVAGTTTETDDEELTNTDELNKKIEEFIRKMKEEMRIEAQTQAIEV